MLIIFPGDFQGDDAVNTTWAVSTEFDRSDYTVLTKIPSELFQTIGNTVQITIMSPAAGGTLNSVYISNAAASGNAYDADTAPTLITWEQGSTSLTMEGGTEYISDPFTFPFMISPKILGFNVGSTTSVTSGYLKNAVSYELTGVQEADDTLRSVAYSPVKDTIYFITNIQVAP